MDDNQYSERIGVRLSQFQADLLKQYCEDFNQPISTTLRRALLQVLAKDKDLPFDNHAKPDEFADRAFTFRVKPSEREQLEGYAKDYKRSYSTVIRAAVDDLLWRVGY